MFRCCQRVQDLSCEEENSGENEEEERKEEGASEVRKHPVPGEMSIVRKCSILKFETTVARKTVQFSSVYFRIWENNTVGGGGDDDRVSLSWKTALHVDILVCFYHIKREM